MKRTGIMAFYDSEGVADDSTIYFMEAVRDVVSELIVVVNGKIRDTSEKKLGMIADEVIIRENLGFDAGAYKAVLCNPDYEEKLKGSDEIVLFNDTCFGPFKPLAQIFMEMEDTHCDYWGINYLENKMSGHLQSYFLVFKSQTYSDLKSYFLENIDEKEADIVNVYTVFEAGLFWYLRRRRFQYGYYSKTNLDIYCSPNFGLLAGLPFMKKRSFDRMCYVHDNCIGALKYILQNYDYDLGLITDTVLRKYGISYELDREFSKELSEERHYWGVADADYGQIIDFCRRNSQLYIYGTGLIARKMYWLYRNYMNEFMGFIVSDKAGQKDVIFDHPVFVLSEITQPDAPILVALNQKNTREVKENLRRFPNCLFLYKD